ncbi:transcriptional regulator [Acidianus sulfidivorans JP7]|uniref:Transcriptional regulator n=1 Tax=Acidianus sulfidivorans JP7 TaxID=619593 RepID=A0A2U9IP94_9CREN|nr:winged helix-turn-helix domain-containing protein [Acidianus sulfidivorans]AWR97869.1 transcriptional regulator [Acidianus sulfidivorans JP7]
MRNKRDQLEIIIDMMEVISKGYNSKSAVMKYANLSNTLLERYVELLMAKGLIEYSDGYYKLTDKGLALLDKLRKIRELNVKLSELINSVADELA